MPRTVSLAIIARQTRQRPPRVTRPFVVFRLPYALPGRVMAERLGELRRSLPALIASIPVFIVFFAVLGIVLTAAGPEGLDLTDAQTSTWIAVLYGLPVLIAL